MPDSRAVDICQKQGQMEDDRAVFDSHFQEIAERILPRQDGFNRHQVQGEKHTERIFDSTGPLALDRAASAIDSLITPATQTYHKLEPEDDRLLEDRATMLYLEQLNKILFRMRYRPAANFQSQSHECYVSLMAFGTLGMFTDDVPGIGVRYKSIALPELYIAENAYGIVDMVHRKFPLSARGAMQKWGDRCPEVIKKTYEKQPFRKFEFIHCVKPNESMKPRAVDYRGMPWASYYVSIEGMELMDVGGYRAMPYQVSRHLTAPREVYGRSPAMMVLPDIKMVNEMEKTFIRVAQKIAQPPLLAYGDGILSSFNSRPNAINYGGVDEQGRQLVVPLKTGSNLPIVQEMAEQKRRTINDAFFVTLFQILVQNPQMTATEALIRAQEKGQLLAPTVGRQQSEFLGPLIERELDIASAAGILPPMPQNLVRSGGGVKARYTSPLTRLRRAEDGVAIMRTIESLGPLAQVRPEVLEVFDEEEVARELADINGVPVKVLRSREMLAELRAQRQQQQEAQAALEQVDTASNAARNMAKASEVMDQAA